MSDHFEKALQGIVLRSKENGGAGVDDLLTAIVATNEDLDDNHEETLSMLAKHVSDGKRRATTLAESLKKYQHEQATECTEKHRSLFADERRIDSEASTIDHAALVAEAAEAAATKTLALAEEKARGVVNTARGVAGEVVHTAEETAAILADAGEEGDIKRAWRTLKWFALAAGIVLVNQLGNMWFGK